MRSEAAAATRASGALSGFSAPAVMSLLGNLPPPPPPVARGVCGTQTWGRERAAPRPGLFPLSYLRLLGDQYY